MTGPMNIPGSLLAAQAASFAKGQETAFNSSKEKAEQARQLRKLLVNAQGAEKNKKTNDTEKGVLA